MKKLISFDLWNTLVKSNPEFSKARIELLKQYSNAAEEDIKSIFKEVKHSFDALVEKYGVQFDNRMLYNIVFDKLNINNIDQRERNLIINQINDLFLEYLPLFYSEDTLEIVKKLKNEKYFLVLISNTLFIDGIIVDKAIEKIGLKQYFHNTVYSSSSYISKPHKDIFYKAYVPLTHNKSEIIHVGDNIRTDLYGAIHYGVDAYIINNSKTTTQFKNKTITDFVNFLETNN